MIELTSGDILKDDSDAIVNTVNCVGIMGRGIALQFKNAWPENFKAYQAACKRDEVQPGRMFMFEVGQLTTPRFIINFPTKRHWKGKSRIEDIDSGLHGIGAEIRSNAASGRWPFRRWAAGWAGLSGATYAPASRPRLSELPDVRVRIFEPKGAPALTTMQHSREVPTMTPAARRWWS
jgi:hypothetical protein